jgi:cystathionine beta-lyase
VKYDFDELIERRGTDCVKWDERPRVGEHSSGMVPSADVIPLWVADMDFKAAPAILEAVKKRAEHGVFGYNIVPESYYEAVISWFRRRHHWEIQREWILYTTAVVPAMSCVIKALTMPGERCSSSRRLITVSSLPSATTAARYWKVF